MDTVKVAVQERTAGEIGAREQALPPQAQQPIVGLTPQQFEQLIAALKGRGGFGDLHELTDEQRAVVDGFARTAAAMGIRRFEVIPAPVKREGQQVFVQAPAGTERARLFLQSTVLTLEVKRGAGQICLPDCISERDRIARIEFLDRRGVVLGVTGGEEPKKEGSEPCSIF